MPKSKEFSVSGSGPTVHLESLDEGTIAVLTLDDSKGTNVMSPEMGDVFSRHIAFTQKDAAVRAVIIRGTGKDFSIGGHRDMLIGLGKPGRSEKELRDFMLAFYNRWLAVHKNAGGMFAGFRAAHLPTRCCRKRRYRIRR